jgi:hypothetical protein
MTDNVFNPAKLTDELLKANLPVVGVSSTGRVDYSRELTKSEKIASAAILAAHDPTATTAEARQAAYIAAGITPNAMVQALWDQVVANDSTRTAAIKEKINLINAQIN